MFETFTRALKRRLKAFARQPVVGARVVADTLPYYLRAPVTMLYYVLGIGVLAGLLRFTSPFPIITTVRQAPGVGGLTPLGTQIVTHAAATVAAVLVISVVLTAVHAAVIHYAILREREDAAATVLAPIGGVLRHPIQLAGASLLFLLSPLFVVIEAVAMVAWAIFPTPGEGAGLPFSGGGFRGYTALMLPLATVEDHSLREALRESARRVEASLGQKHVTFGLAPLGFTVIVALFMGLFVGAILTATTGETVFRTIAIYLYIYGTNAAVVVPYLAAWPARAALYLGVTEGCERPDWFSVPLHDYTGVNPSDDYYTISMEEVGPSFGNSDEETE